MARKGFLERLVSHFAPASGEPAEVSQTAAFHLPRGKVRVLHHCAPIRVSLLRVGTELLLCPEFPLHGDMADSPPSYVIVSPDQCDKGIHGFLRLEGPGDGIVIGKHDRVQSSIFDYPGTMDLRRLSIQHDGDALIFRALVSDADIELRRVTMADTVDRIRRQRQERLARIAEIYGAPMQPLDPVLALETLRAVNTALENEPYRPLDDRGMPGGVIRLPAKPVPVIVGDLHAQLDNLLTLLSQNTFLDALEQGQAVLIILGDAVHSELEGQLDRMDQSIHMMDLILRLKLRFPAHFFYIRGNHDSFSDSVFKHGVAQCLMWESALRRLRGDAYVDEMARYYERLPHLVISDDFVACHAAPVKTRFTLDMLINIHRHPGLARELTQNRIRRRNLPAGYTRADVKHFRDTLGLDERTPFFVSHSPLDRVHPLWQDAGGIRNHHIVFSANIPWIGVFTRIGGKMIPLSYRQEKLLGPLEGART